MPGKLCNGTPTDQPYISNSRAYCEGRAAAVAGALITTNPHALEPDKSFWDDGWNSYNGGVGTPFQDCCADPGYA